MKKSKPISLEEQRAWYKLFKPMDERARPQTPTERWNAAGKPLQVTAFVTRVVGAFTYVQDEYFRTIIYTKHSKSCPRGLKEGTVGLLVTRKAKGLPVHYEFILKKKGKRK